MVEDKKIDWIGYIYTENRSRQPDEYPNYWKEEVRIGEKLEEQGLDKDTPITALVDKLTALSQSQDSNTEEIARLNKDNESLREIILNYTESITNLSKNLEQHNNTIVALDIKNKQREEEIKCLANGLLNKGDHSEDCNYSDAIACGRILEQTESEICSCGWVKIRTHVVELLSPPMKSSNIPTEQAKPILITVPGACITSSF